MNAYFIINIDVTAYRSLHNDFFLFIIHLHDSTNFLLNVMVTVIKNII